MAQNCLRCQIRVVSDMIQDQIYEYRTATIVAPAISFQRHTGQLLISSLTPRVLFSIAKFHIRKTCTLTPCCPLPLLNSLPSGIGTRPEDRDQPKRYNYDMAE